jgi:ATP phosphoribosyltransferase regulatory subunit HisZ
MTANPQGMVATHLLEVLLLAVQKLRRDDRIKHRVIILGVAEMLGDLLRACPLPEQDGLLREAIYTLHTSATEARPEGPRPTIMPPSATEH